MSNILQHIDQAWIITNAFDSGHDQKLLKTRRGIFNFLHGNKCNVIEYPSLALSIMVDGFILPRIDLYDEYSVYLQDELVKRLYTKFGLEFIHKIKGSFSILIFDQNQLHIFTDHHSFKKVYIYQNGDETFFTNQINTIPKGFELQIDPEHIALFCLLQHFVEGKTMFKNLYYSKPASHISIDLENNAVKIGNYLKADHFNTLKRNSFNLNHFTELWSKMIYQYVDFLKPKSISMTITGGNDSRMILSALIKNKINVNLFSFGDPRSFDAIIAKQLGEISNMPYSNYFVNLPHKDWQNDYSEKIISFGNSLINIHRAHRLDAIEREMENHPEVEMLFGGFMGGDYIKGLKYEDYITSRLIRELEFNPKNKPVDAIVEELLFINYLNKNKLNIPRLIELVKKLPFISESDKRHREFLVLYNMVGSIHDMQDTNVFANKVRYVINPFMDIDFMEQFLPSNYSPFHKCESFITKKLRMNRSLFHLTITNNLAPEFSKINYSKGGYYNTSEYFGNKLLLLIKRLYRYKFKKPIVVQNFPLTIWMSDYCVEQLNLIAPPITALFDLEALQNQLLNSSKKPTTEGYWHKFTNPINIYLNYKHFNNK